MSHDRGYRTCGREGCPEVTINKPGALCDECEEAATGGVLTVDIPAKVLSRHHVFVSLKDSEAPKRRLDENPLRVFVAATGGGASIQQALWETPGASKIFVGGAFPYDQESTIAFLGYKPTKFVSQDTALGMAHAAYINATVSKQPGMAIGIGVTAAVASTRVHKGDYEVWLALVCEKGACTFRQDLNPRRDIGMAARMEDEHAIKVKVLDMLHSAVGDAFLVSDSAISAATFHKRPFFQRNGTRTAAPSSENLLLVPGAFNPVHEGHFGLARAAELASGREATFHVALEPPHKEHMTITDALSRVHQFRGHNLLFGTDEALYIDKARKFPGAHFAVGLDAVTRMLDEKWGPVMPMIQEFLHLNTVFYCAYRSSGYPSDAECEASFFIHRFPDLFVPVQGRWNISSTEIRNGNK